MNLSFFTNHGVVTPKDITLDEVVRITKTKYQDDIERLRSCDTKEKRDAIKATLPAVTLSGSFRFRKIVGLEKHTGLMTVDLDHLSDDTIAAIRPRLEADENIAFGFLSPSGQGLKLAVRVTVPSDGATHMEAYFACERYFLAQYLQRIDPACKDVCRLTYLSWDPDCWFRSKGTAIQWTDDDKIAADNYRALQQKKRSKRSTDFQRRAEELAAENKTLPARSPEPLPATVLPPGSLEWMLEKTVQMVGGKNHKALWLLASRARGWSKTYKITWSPDQLDYILTSWYNASLTSGPDKTSVLRADDSYDIYRMEFENAFQSDQMGYETPDTIGAAWSSINPEKLPHQARRFKDQRLQRVVALCVALATASENNGEFFIPTKRLANLIGVASIQTAATVMQGLCNCNPPVLEKTSDYTPGRACNRYKLATQNKTKGKK